MPPRGDCMNTSAFATIARWSYASCPKPHERIFTEAGHAERRVAAERSCNARRILVTARNSGDRRLLRQGCQAEGIAHLALSRRRGRPLSRPVRLATDGNGRSHRGARPGRRVRRAEGSAPQSRRRRRVPDHADRAQEHPAHRKRRERQDALHRRAAAACVTPDRRHRDASTTRRTRRMTTNTIRLHRGLRAPPERVYRAFLDADALAKWLPPNGFTCKVHHLDAKIGGTHKMSFTNFTTGNSHSFGGKYLELVPHERIRYTDQ